MPCSPRRAIVLAALLELVVATGAHGDERPVASCTLDRATGTTIDAEPFLRDAYAAHWNLATHRIAFMRPNDEGYYRVFVMRPDGSGIQELAQTHFALPAKHIGAPSWHPSGHYLLVEGQKADWSGRKLFGIPDYEALPGFGRHDDIWLVAVDGQQSWQLTREPNTKDEGALLPVFSPDGRRIAWSSRGPGGKYTLKIADFVDAPEPHLDNVRSFQPGGPAYYETGSFSSDGASLFYTSDQDTHSFWRSQIYRLDIASGTATRLTAGNAYNEHPSIVATPTGDWIVYMSTKGVERFTMRLMLGTDWYAMRADGTGAKRLTTMNVRHGRSENPENVGQPQVAGTVAVSPFGDYLLGDVQDNLVKQSGLVRIVRFTCR